MTVSGRSLVWPVRAVAFVYLVSLAACCLAGAAPAPPHPKYSVPLGYTSWYALGLGSSARRPLASVDAVHPDALLKQLVSGSTRVVVAVVPEDVWQDHVLSRYSGAFSVFGRDFVSPVAGLSELLAHAPVPQRVSVAVPGSFSNLVGVARALSTAGFSVSSSLRSGLVVGVTEEESLSRASTPDDLPATLVARLGACNVGEPLVVGEGGSGKVAWVVDLRDGAQVQAYPHTQHARTVGRLRALGHLLTHLHTACSTSWAGSSFLSPSFQADRLVIVPGRVSDGAEPDTLDPIVSASVMALPFESGASTTQASDGDLGLLTRLESWVWSSGVPSLGGLGAAANDSPTFKSFFPVSFWEVFLPVMFLLPVFIGSIFCLVSLETPDSFEDPEHRRVGAKKIL